MTHLTNIIFFLGLSLLLVHELDAVKRHEWRIFPILSSLPEKTAYILFVSLHLPLFTLILFYLTHPNPEIRYWFIISMDIFFIAHMGLHGLYKNHKENDFENGFSKVIISLMAIFGGCHLLLIAILKFA